MLLVLAILVLSTLSGSAQFTLTPEPEDVEGQPTYFYCEGETTLTFTVEYATDLTYTHYQLFDGVVSISPVIPSGVSVTLNPLIEYTAIGVQKSNDDGTEQIALSGTFDITESASPTISFSSNQTEYCDGEPFDISVNEPSDDLSYAWEINDNDIPTDGGVLIGNATIGNNDISAGNNLVEVIATDGNECPSNTLSVMFEVFENPTILFEQGSDQTEYCDGSPWNIIVNDEPGFDYTWFKDEVETPLPINVDTDDTGQWLLLVENQDNDQCSLVSDEFNVEVFANPEITNSTSQSEYCEGSDLNLQVDLSAGLELNTVYKWSWSVEVFEVMTNIPALNNANAQFFDCDPSECVGCPSTNQSYSVKAIETHVDLMCESVEISIPIVVNDSVTGSFSESQIATIICNDISSYNLENLIDIDESCDSSSLVSSWFVDELSISNQDSFDFTSFSQLNIPVTRSITRGECTSEIGSFMNVLASPLTIEYALDTMTTYCAGETLNISAQVVGISTPGTDPVDSIEWSSSPEFFNFDENEFIAEPSSSSFDSLTWTASMEYQYQINGFNKTCQASAPSSSSFMTFVTDSYTLAVTVDDEDGYCQEELPLDKTSVFSVNDNPFNLNDFQDSPFTHQITISGLGPDTTIDYEQFDNVPWPDSNVNDVQLTYVLNHEFCERSMISDVFSIYQTPSPISIVEHICEDNSSLNLEPLFPSNYFLDGGLSTLPTSYIESDVVFVPDPSGLNLNQIDTINIGGNFFTNLGNCIVDIDEFDLIVYPEISFVDSTLGPYYYCNTEGQEVTVSWDGGIGPYDYTLSTEGNGITGTTNLELDLPGQSELVLVEISSDLEGTTRKCQADTSISVIVNTSPVTPSLLSGVDDLFTQYCAEDDTTEFELDVEVAQGFTLDSIELMLGTSQDYSYTIPFSSLSGGIVDTISIAEFPDLAVGNALSEPLFYQISYYIDPIHLCPIGYNVAGDTLSSTVNFYEGIFIPDQPRPQIAVLDSLFCPDQNFFASIENGDSNNTYSWNGASLPDTITFDPDSLGADDLSAIWVIPEIPDFGSFQISLVETDGDCSGRDTLTVFLNDDTTQVPRAEIFELSSNGALVYNDSTACYQWGRIVNGSFVPIEEETFQTYIPLENDTTEIVCQAWYKAPGETDCGVPTGCYNIQFQKSLNVIDSEVQDLGDFPMNIYPNPNSGSFNIALTNLLKEQSYSIHLYDLMGRLIDQQAFVPSEPTRLLNMTAENLASGMYQVVLTLSDRKIAAQKVIIQ